MENLQVTLNKMQDTLNDLEAILAEEIKQLSYAQVNAIALQQLSDNKSRLLSTLAWHDEQRNQQEKQLRLFAPYTHQATLAACWANLLRATQKANEMNIQTSHLLQMHMQKVRALGQLMDKVAAAPTLYTAGGQSTNNGKARAYKITI